MEVEKKEPLYKKWWAWVIGLFLVSAVLSSLSGGFSQTETLSDQYDTEYSPTSGEVHYRKVFTFSGSGAKNSEPFTVQGDRFKISYDCKATQITTLCQAFVYNVNSKIPHQLVMNAAHATKDETILYGSGEYYISSNTIGTFTMTVYDYR